MEFDYSLLIATQNGSGSQSPNHILAKSIFRSGYTITAKNIFPSNIAGLPTWYAIRFNNNGFTSMKRAHNLVLAKNVETWREDISKLLPGGLFLYDKEFRIESDQLRKDVTCIEIDFRELTRELSTSIKMRKLLSNTVYLGVLTELLSLESTLVESTLRDYFSDKPQVIEVNLAALAVGRKYSRENLINKFSVPILKNINTKNQDRLFIDGNSAAALGALTGGCSFFAWYPITPATSLAENFGTYAEKTRKPNSTTAHFAQVQAEDELSAINMVIGAGWAGSRAMTSTSGPGLSLMAEGAGLSYFAEIPSVIWDVQRAGPSTGLPTRTLQGDLRFAHHLSHGDTEHIVLLPSNPLECFQMGQLALEIAEQLQTLVIVLSDLDLGMNFHSSEIFQISKQEFDRGKVLNATDLQSRTDFARYRDIDGDGVGYRTLPGTPHPRAAYFTRGTAHNDKSGYSEDSDNFRALLDRLKMKIAQGQKYLPKPILNENSKPQNILIVTYGTTEQIVPELKSTFAAQNIHADFLRIRALPLAPEIHEFFKNRKHIFIVEQNRDGQMRGLLASKFPEHAVKFHSILQYDGLPISAELVLQEFNLWKQKSNFENSQQVAP